MMDATTTTTVEPRAERRRQARKVRGLGGVYQRGEVFWIHYSHRGRQYLESSHSSNRRVAENLLKARLQALGKGEVIAPVVEERVTVPALFDLLTTDYDVNKRKSAGTLRWRLAPLRDAFGRDRAVDVTEQRIEAYKAARLAEGKAHGTINRELAALRRAFKLAVRRKILNRAPFVELLAEDNARQGFMGAAEADALYAALPEYLRDAFRWAYLTGWRKGEVQSLRWADFDRDGAGFRLRRENTKGSKARFIPCVGELGENLARRGEARHYKTGAGSGISEYVFHQGDGQPLGDHRKAWAAACIKAGLYRVVRVKTQAGDEVETKVPTKIFHDCRRSAVRNMVRAGVPETVARQISGHRTRSVFDRYDIVSEQDIADALTKTQDALKATAEKRTVVPFRSAQGAS